MREARDVDRARRRKSSAGRRAKGAARPRLGFAFARYKNLAAYCAIASEVEVNSETGRPGWSRAVAAVDSGQVVNPDGLRNQIEGGIVQSMSWTLYEAVTFDDTSITSLDWRPIRSCASTLSRQSTSISSTGPANPSSAAARPGRARPRAAIANAIANATGKRLRDLPLTRKRIKDAIDA